MAKSKKEIKDKLALIRKRASLAFDADRRNRQAAMEDLKFLNVPGEQWDDIIRKERGDRPCYEFNKIRITVKRVVNDMRSNRPSGKVRGTEETDKDTAEIYEGLIRNIWNVSDGDTAIDAAGEFQVGCGMGAWRVTVDYSSDSAFEQDIRIEGIRNPFCLYADPACQDPLKRDARFWILTSRISKEAYEARWPDAEVSEFDSENEFDDDDEWSDEETVRIVEYWYREPVKKTVALLSNGQTIDISGGIPEGAEVVRSREIESSRIAMCIASGSAILEEADWAGPDFPFVQIFGEQMIIDGENRWFGLTRFAKDAQRSYNYSRTLAVENIALAPQSKWWATPTQAKGHEKQWSEAHQKLYPFMLYNPDPAAGGAPQRMPGADVPVALINEAQLSSEDIKGVTGIFDPSLGKQSNEISGIAIRARQAQGEIATFNYMDNMSKGIRRTWEILINLIPKIYDTERAVRILGADGAEKFVKINQNINGQVFNDLNHGKYDVTVTVGPSFSTQRQEAAEVYTQFVQANPALLPIIGDLIAKSFDLPYSDQIANRLKLMLPPQIQEAEAQGQNMSPEVMQAMAQAEQAMQMVQQQGMLVQQAAAEAQTEKAEAEKAKADLQVQAAKLQADYQKIIADITRRETDFMLSQAKAGTDESGKVVAQDREALSAQVQQALAQIQQQAAEFMTQAAAVIADIQAKTQPQVVVADPPKSKTVRMKKVGNEYIATVEESVNG